MRYKDIRPAKAADITKITQQQLAAQDAQSMPVQSDRAIHGKLRRELAVDIANDDAKNVQPSFFDKAMAFRQVCITKNAANKDAAQQFAKAKQLQQRK
jgi:hypothetical protein